MHACPCATVAVAATDATPQPAHTVLRLLQEPSEDPPLDTIALTPFNTFAGLAGGIGLFLLGMHMLTEGLKLAAGRALEGLLERGTATPLRGLGAGMTMTALVQSSTAVTVASIGFVNTGLLSLQNAMWVIFGSNVGTTLNAWLVAALGFSFRIDAFALPFVGFGALLMLAGRTVRQRALGQALAGFGVLFLGIDVLKDTFSVFGATMNLQDHIAPGFTGWLVLVGIGILLTVLMQASGAVIAIIITAAQGGLMSIEAACAMVIGTNIGTTSTAILSALGATSNARRLAATHVLFNLVTGAVAILLLPLLIGLLGLLRAWFEQPATPAVMIAMFHSAFNLLGVLLMVPLARPLLRYLADHFRSREEEIAHPRHLDAPSLAVPDLALRALRLELGRTQSFAVTALTAATRVPPDEPWIERQASALDALAPAITDYVRKLSAMRLPPTLVEALAHSLRALQYQESAVIAVRQACALATTLGMPPGTELEPVAVAFRQATGALAASADAARDDFSAAAVEVRLEETELRYQAFKETLLLEGAHARLDIRAMQDWLRLASLERRAIEQVAKAARMLAVLDGDLTPQQAADAGGHAEGNGAE
jgi:phosphate:Na+ symporter